MKPTQNEKIIEDVINKNIEVDNFWNIEEIEQSNKNLHQDSLKKEWLNEFCLRVALKDALQKKDAEFLAIIDGLDDLFLSKADTRSSQEGDMWIVSKKDWNRIVQKLKGENV